jgi:hypothetical protein
MATCNVTTLMAEAGCFDCLSSKQLDTVIAALLCKILQQLDPTATCTLQTLVTESKCFDCLTPQQLQLVQTQLLCEIKTIVVP